MLRQIIKDKFGEQEQTQSSRGKGKYIEIFDDYILVYKTSTVFNLFKTQ